MTGLPGSYPVLSYEVKNVFWRYPSQIFQGSEFHTTLFGLLPFLWLFLLELKILASLFYRYFPSRWRIHQIDLFWLASYGVFFLFLEFFPSQFRKDLFYSIPRTFQYLYPISLPLTLHVFTMLLDYFHFEDSSGVNTVTGGNSAAKARRTPKRTVAFFALTISLCIFGVVQGYSATRPPVEFSRALKTIASEVKQRCPPAVYGNLWTVQFLKLLLKTQSCPQTRFESPTVKSSDHSSTNWAWLSENQTRFEKNSILVVNLPSFTRRSDANRERKNQRPATAME